MAKHRDKRQPDPDEPDHTEDLFAPEEADEAAPAEPAEDSGLFAELVEEETAGPSSGIELGAPVEPAAPVAESPSSGSEVAWAALVEDSEEVPAAPVEADPTSDYNILEPEVEEIPLASPVAAEADDEDATVDLAKMLEGGASSSSVLDVEQGPPSGQSSVPWSALVGEGAERDADDDATVRLDAPSDHDIIEHLGESDSSASGDNVLDLVGADELLDAEAGGSGPPAGVAVVEDEGVVDLNAILAEESGGSGSGRQASADSAVPLVEALEEEDSPVPPAEEMPLSFVPEEAPAAPELAVPLVEEPEPSAEEPLALLAEEEEPVAAAPVAPAPVADAPAAEDDVLVPQWMDEEPIEEEVSVAEQEPEGEATPSETSGLNLDAASEEPLELAEPSAVPLDAAEVAESESPSGTIDLAALEPASSEPITGDEPSGSELVDLAAAGEEPLEVAAQGESDTWQGNDLDLAEAEAEVEDDASALDLGATEPSQMPRSDLNLVSEALEPGVSEAYMGAGLPGKDEDEEVPLDFYADAAEESEESSKLDLGSMPRPRDIAEQVESGQDLIGSDQELEAVLTEDDDEDAVEAILEDDEDAAEAVLEDDEAEAVVEDDSAVDLGAPSKPVLDLDEPEAGEAVEEQPTEMDDFDQALLEETKETEVSEEAEEQAFDLGEADSEAVADEAEVAEEDEVVMASVGAEPDSQDEEPQGVEDKGTKKPKPERRRGGIGSLAAGLFLGLLVGAGGLYGALAGGVLEGLNLPGLPAAAKAPQAKSGPGQPAPAPGPGVPVAAADPAQAVEHLQVGNFDKALQALPENDPQHLAARGEALFLRSLQRAALKPAPVNLAQELKTDADVQKAVELLTQANNADAMFWVGQIYEYQQDLAKAKAEYEKGLKLPTLGAEQKLRLEAALTRLELLGPVPPPAPPMAQGQPARDGWVVLALVALQMAQPPMPPPPPPGAAPVAPAPQEAGTDFWNALRLARSRDFAGAITALDKARTLHDVRRLTQMRKPQNPLTDPSEQIFLKACDEIKQRWQLEMATGAVEKDLRDGGFTTLADGLKAGDPAKGLATLAGAIKTVAGELKTAKIDKVDDLGVAVKALAAERDAEATKLAAVVKELQDAKVEKVDDVAAAVKTLAASRAAEGDKLATVVKELKDAKVEKFADVPDPTAFKGGKDELASGIKALAADKDRVAAMIQALKDAKITPKADDPAAGVKLLTVERDSANRLQSEILKVMVEANRLKPDTSHDELPKAVATLTQTADHPLVKGLAQVVTDLGAMGGKVGDEVLKGLNVQSHLAAAGADNVKLQAQLADRRTPQEMLNIWLPLMLERGRKDVIPEMMKDVERADAGKPSPEGLCLKALAARNEGKYDEARAALVEFGKDAKTASSDNWRKAAAETEKQLTRPDAYYLPEINRLQAEGQLDRALGVLDEAVQVFSKDAFPEPNAVLMAMRSLARLDLARKAAKPDAALLDASQKDAAAAVAGGQTVEGNFAAARAAETAGDLAGAEQNYRAALDAFTKADADMFKQEHPLSDASGNRYRVGLARVKLELSRKAKTKEAPKAEADKLSWLPSLQGLLTLSVVMVNPADVAAVAGAEPAKDPQLEEAIKLAEEAIKKDPKDAEAHLILGRALAEKGEYTAGLKHYVEGLKYLSQTTKGLTPEQAARLNEMVDTHPAFKRPDGVKPPDPLAAEGFYGMGLRLYFDRRWKDSEKAFTEAVRYNDQDARFLYYLGLARLAQRDRKEKFDEAKEDFRAAARLEQQNKPSRGAVSTALERVQGPTRQFLNEIRDGVMRQP